MIPSSYWMSMPVFLAPLIVALVVYALRMKRKQAEAERDALPLDTKPEPEPGALLRRFSPAERTYLRVQFKSLPYIFAYLTWIFAFLLSIPVFIPWGQAHLWTDLRTMYWYEFLDSVARGPQFIGMFVLFVAFGSLVPMRWAGFAPFYRTRPVTIGVLFWGRVLPWLTVLMLSLATAMLVAFGLFYLLQGPAWQHLPALIPRRLGADDADIAASYAGLLLTSTPRVFLSFFTASCLYAGVSILAASIPIGSTRGPTGPRGVILIMAVVAMAPPVLNLVAVFNNLHAPRWLFLYTSFGPPPPYAYALVPFSIAAACILLARRLIARVEL